MSPPKPKKMADARHQSYVDLLFGLGLTRAYEYVQCVDSFKFELRYLCKESAKDYGEYDENTSKLTTASMGTILKDMDEQITQFADFFCQFWENDWKSSTQTLAHESFCKWHQNDLENLVSKITKK